MNLRRALALVGSLGLCALAHPASAACIVKNAFQAPVTIVGGHPNVLAQVNRHELAFTIDSGAAYNTIDEPTAQTLGLLMINSNRDMYVTGVGGTSSAHMAIGQEVTIDGKRLGNMVFLVQPLSGMNVLGQTLLGRADVEYDLPHSVIRLMRPEGCDKDSLAYWALPTQGLSVVSLEWPKSKQISRTAGPVEVNGRKMTAMFDTGAQRSMLTLAAASRLGVKPDSPGVVQSGVIYGAGNHAVQMFTGTFASVKIGAEEIKNVRLQFGKLSLDDVDMVIGDDFFLSHRVYVANSQHKIYITYEGGPVFDLEAKPLVQDASGQAPHEVPAASNGSDPTDAGGFARRASVYLTQRDFDHAIADLSRAIEMAPGKPNYLFQRANARLAANQTALALGDLDQAVKLASQSVQILMMRARVRLAEHDNAGAIADLNAALAVLRAPQDDWRLSLGQGYAAAGLQDQAIGQYDQWISLHQGDGRMAQALLARCNARALLGRELDQALADCNRAIGLAPKAAEALDMRGIVRLKIGDYARALGDYDAALKAKPKDPLALYGRGLSELKLGKTVEGQSDLTAAASLQPNIAAQVKTFGLAPG